MTSRVTRSFAVWISLQAESSALNATAIQQPAELPQTGGINQAQQGFAPLQRLRQLLRGKLLKCMQPLRQPQGQHHFPLAAVIQPLPALTRGGSIQCVDADVAGEVLGPW